MKVTLSKGKYYFKERNISYNVENDMAFDLENSLYNISGNNGIGKTTFIELLLIPFLKREKLDFAYLEQNKNNQLYTIQASLAFSPKYDKSKDIYINWLETLDYPEILILDEFDKYKSTFKKILTIDINCVFWVSHMSKEKDYSKFKNIMNINIFLDSNSERIVKLETKERVW